jgi:outer membrane protein assembly factor BamB
MSQSGRLFIGIQGYVLALDRATGQELWRTKLKGYEFVNVVLQDGDIYATAQGELYSLDSATGEIRWHNPLKGLGRGMVSIAVPVNQQSLLVRERQRQEEEAAGAASISGG